MIGTQVEQPTRTRAELQAEADQLYALLVAVFDDPDQCKRLVAATYPELRT